MSGSVTDPNLQTYISAQRKGPDQGAMAAHLIGYGGRSAGCIRRVSALPSTRILSSWDLVLVTCWRPAPGSENTVFLVVLIIALGVGGNQRLIQTNL